MDEKYKVDFEGMDWQTPAIGARFKSFKNGNRQLRLVEFTDEFVELEWCEKGHIGMLLDGILEISFNGKIVRYKAGDGIFIPAGKSSAHKGRSITPVSKMILVEEL